MMKNKTKSKFKELRSGFISKSIQICFILFVFSFLGSMQANSLHSQEAGISMSLNNVSLERFFSEIEKNSNYVVLYKNDLASEKNVSVKVKNENIENVLNKTLSPLNLKYSINGRQIVVAENAKESGRTAETNQVTQSAERTVKGKVSDSSGEPLIGVTVVVKGTTIGVTTDLDGRYELRQVPSNAVLVFSYIGYNKQEVVVGSKTEVNAVLASDESVLDEIVVVGYGIQRKSDVVGSISVAKGSDILAQPVTNALEGLKGRVSGVTIMSTTGNPMGNQGSQQRVLIRGINSINTSTNPLYVVDGVQMEDIQFLNPNDIERMEVLKDASATAIYGARGANGVIMVSTKRGTIGEIGTRISYAGWMNVSTLAKEIDLLNSDEFMEVQRIGFSNIGYFNPNSTNIGLTPSTSSPLLFDANGKPLYNTNWQREATRDAVSHSHQLTIQSQGEKSSTGAFLNYTDQQGLLLNNYLKRLNAKLTYDTKVNKWLKIDTNLMVNHVWGNSVDDSDGGQTARRTMWEMPPIFPVTFPDGSWANTLMGDTNFGLEAMPNPVHELKTVKRSRYRTKIFANFGTDFTILPDLVFRNQIGVDANITTNKDYYPNDLINMSAPLGRAQISHDNFYYWQNESYFTYMKSFNKIHRLNATLGLSWSRYTRERDQTGDVKGFSDNFFGYDNLGTGTLPSAPGSSFTDWSMNSYFARASYALKDRYLATATVRIDGSSRFGSNNKYATFPSMGLGWVISEENFMRNQSNWLTSMKLHTSYGSTGNTEIISYSTLPLLSVGTGLLNGNRAPSNILKQMPNPDLKWERTDQFDIGVDLRLLDSRINIEASYYYKKTNDLLLERPLPYVTGFTSVMDNIGRVDNQGIDFMLNTLNIDHKDFKWESTFNINYNKNEIKQLGINNEDILTDPEFLDGRIILRVGESLGSFYGYERLGVWGTDEAEEAAKVGALPGEAKRSKEKKILGKGLPDVTGSFINKFYYKNWDFVMDLQFVAGVDTWQLFKHSAEDRTGIANTLATTLHNAWTATNQNTMVQKIRQQNYSGQNSINDSHWVADGSYIRGNMIQLGYTFDANKLKKIGLNSLRVNASVNNAFLICSKDFQGYDPEGSSNTNRFGQNVFFYQYPSARVFSLGLNVSF